MRLIRHVVLTVFALATLLAVALAVVSYDAYQQMTAPAGFDKPARVSIPRGTGCAGIVSRLRQHNVFQQQRGAWYWRAWGRVTGACGHLKSGHYRLTPDMTPQAVLAAFANGDTANATLTIVPGRRFKQLLHKIKNTSDLEHDLAGKTADQAMAAIGHKGENPEGRFLPDTYRFPIGTSDKQFLKHAYDAMQRFLTDKWPQRANETVVKTPYQALILASIIEKETAAPAERGRISGVFSRRLRRDMRLQTDPTVIYGLSSFGQKLSRDDLRHATPYNTYVHGGLPPTPIATPSRAAIRAALHPKEGSALYFVAKGNGNGQHAFSATLSGQRAAIRRYR